jgi:hypothetical protein
MRLSLMAGLLVGSMAVWTLVPATPCRAERAQLPVAAGAAVRTDNPTWEVEGFGKTRDTAEENALKDACEKVVEHLTRKYGSNVFLPDPTYLREARMARVVEVKPVDLPHSGEVQKVTLVVELKPENVQDLLRQGREQRSLERQRIAALGLGGVVVLLLVVVGYLRLEDATKGYYTTLLRLAAVSLLGLTGVFLYRLGSSWL